MADWKTPDALKYTKSDEWIRVEGDSGTIGITDYAQDALNDIVYVEPPEVGDEFGQDDSFGTVESVKAASDLHMPVAGTITEVNSALEDDPELMNTDPFGAGWVAKITISDASQLDGLMDAAAYAQYCTER